MRVVPILVRVETAIECTGYDKSFSQGFSLIGFCRSTNRGMYKICQSEKSLH